MTVFSLIPSEEKETIDIYTIAEFIETCKIGAFIDYDGHGCFTAQLKTGEYVESGINIHPSGILKMLISELPSWATHVIWYNR